MLSLQLMQATSEQEMVVLCQIRMDRVLVRLNTLRASTWELPTVGLQIIYNTPSVNETLISLDDVKEIVKMLKGENKAGVGNLHLESLNWIHSYDPWLYVVVTVVRDSGITSEQYHFHNPQQIGLASERNISQDQTHNQPLRKPPPHFSERDAPLAKWAFRDLQYTQARCW